MLHDPHAKERRIRRDASRAGGSLLDTRGAPLYAEGTIPGARHLPHDAVADHLALVAADRAPHVLFCNGPQCPATPKVVGELLDLGVPPGLLRYYRGGLHDWLTLGLPVAPPAA